MHDRERLPCATLNWLLDSYREVTPLANDAVEQIAVWSLLNAIRALARDIRRNPDSQIVTTARDVIRQGMVDHL